jgi:L-ectoine synthase
MILRNLEDAERSDRRVVAENWESVRLLLRGDSMGFSFHITTIYPGTETHIWYKNHLESVYCIEGEGEVEILDGTDNGGVADAVRIGESGDVEQANVIHRIAPGTIYILDKNDRHILRSKTTMKLACVFNPPLNGREIHDEDGVYPLDGEDIAG